MAKMGLQEETCMMLGRWKSQSWKVYAKAGRGIRREELQRITSLVLSSVRDQTTTVEVVDSEFEVPW